jgi:hypothetical protein
MVIDPNLMYRAGRSSRMRPRSGAARRADLYDKILGYVGQIAVNRYSQLSEELGEFKQKWRNASSTVNGLVNDVGAAMNPEFRSALKDWRKEYIKGKRKSKFGLSEKKREEGNYIANNAYNKIKRLHAQFQDISGKVAKYENQVALQANEKPPNYAGQGFNSGDSDDRIILATELANGKLWQSMGVNRETADIVYLQQTQNESGKNITTKIPYTNLDWPTDEDDSLQGVQTGYVDEAIKNGNKGRIWDELYGKLQYDKIKASVQSKDNGGIDAQRSFFFGGTVMPGVNEKLETSSLAYITLKNAKHPQTGEPLNLQEGTPEWRAALQSLKTDLTFAEGSDETKMIIDYIYSATERYHKNYYNQWELKNQKKRDKNTDKETTIAGTIDLGMSRFNRGEKPRKLIARREDVVTKNRQITNSKKGDIIQGWEGPKTYRYKNMGNGRFMYQEYNEDSGKFENIENTTGMTPGPVRVPQGQGYYTIDDVKMDLIPQVLQTGLPG